MTTYRPKRRYALDGVAPPLTGLEYRRHTGCRHAVRSHAYRDARTGCREFISLPDGFATCRCRETRVELTGRPDWLGGVDLALRLIGAITVIAYVARLLF